MFEKVTVSKRPETNACNTKYVDFPRRGPTKEKEKKKSRTHSKQFNRSQKKERKKENVMVIATPSKNILKGLRRLDEDLKGVTNDALKASKRAIEERKGF